MGISFIDKAVIAPAADTSIIVTPPALAQVGDLLLEYIAYDSASGTLGTPPSGWTVIDSNAPGDLGNWWGWHVYQGEASWTWPFTGAPTRGSIMRAYRGQAAAPIDAHGPIAAGTLNTIASNGIAVASGEWFVFYSGVYSTGATVVTPPSGLANAVVDANMASYDSGASDPGGSVSGSITWSQNGGHSYAEGIAIVPVPPPPAPGRSGDAGQGRRPGRRRRQLLYARSLR